MPKLPAISCPTRQQLQIAPIRTTAISIATFTLTDLEAILVPISLAVCDFKSCDFAAIQNLTLPQRSAAKGVWETSDEEIDRSIRKSSQRVTQNEKSDQTPFVDLLLLPTSFCGTLKIAAIAILPCGYLSYSISLCQFLKFPSFCCLFGISLGHPSFLGLLFVSLSLSFLFADMFLPFVLSCQFALPLLHRLLCYQCLLLVWFLIRLFGVQGCFLISSCFLPFSRCFFCSLSLSLSLSPPISHLAQSLNFPFYLFSFWLSCSLTLSLSRPLALSALCCPVCWYCVFRDFLSLWFAVSLALARFLSCSLSLSLFVCVCVFALYGWSGSYSPFVPCESLEPHYLLYRASIWDENVFG